MKATAPDVFTRTRGLAVEPVCAACGPSGVLVVETRRAEGLIERHRRAHEAHGRYPGWNRTKERIE